MPTTETTGPVTITVDIDGHLPSEPWRTGLTYTIAVDGLEYVGNDLSVGIGGTDAEIEREALYSVVSFLDACNESIEYDERNGIAPGDRDSNADLFPRWLMEALEPHIEDVQYLGMDPREWPDSHFKGEAHIEYEVTDWLFDETRALPRGCVVKVPTNGTINAAWRGLVAGLLMRDCWHDVTEWDTLDESSDRDFTEIVLEWVA